MYVTAKSEVHTTPHLVHTVLFLTHKLCSVASGVTVLLQGTKKKTRGNYTLKYFICTLFLIMFGYLRSMRRTGQEARTARKQNYGTKKKLVRKPQLIKDLRIPRGAREIIIKEIRRT